MVEHPDYLDWANWVDISCPMCGSENIDVSGTHDKKFDCLECEAAVWF